MKDNTDMFRFLILIGITILVASCGSIEVPQDVQLAQKNLPAEIDYNLHVKPILSDRCFVCHGPDKNKQKAGLRLDIAEDAYNKECENGLLAIDPGNLAKSEVIHRILSADPEYVMPEPECHLTLSAEEKAILVKWVEQGAKYKKHWSFIEPQKVALPQVQNMAWIKNPIDNFILKKLESESVKPQVEAEKTTLLRRVYMDLIGLPPTPQEVDNFVADKSVDAYEKVVNKLLKNPHFGEHQAVDWLDVARYADTHGYQDDGLRTMWPYRDWVIRAFNQNLRFSKFVVWQLAGDMLPNPNKDQLLATAFNRNHQQSQEGGIVPEEYRTEYVADRTNTFGKAFLGLTVECARCHDHKYDPISQKDYYSLFAFFNNNNENGQIPYNGEASPTITLTTPEAEQKLRFIHAKLSTTENQLTVNQAYKSRFEQWLRQVEQTPEKAILPVNQDVLGHFSFDEPTGKKFQNLVKAKHFITAEGDDSLSNVAVVNGRFGKARHIFGDNAVNFGQHYAFFERNQPFSVSVWFNIKSPKTVGSLMHKSNGVMNGYRGWKLDRLPDGRLKFAMSNVWPDNCIDLETVEKFPLNAWTNFTFSYNGLSNANGLKLYINGKEAVCRVIKNHLTQSILHGKNNTNWGYELMMIGRMSDQRVKDYEVDELKIYTKPLTPLEVQSLCNQEDMVLKVVKNKQRSITDQKDLLQYYLLNFDSEFKTNLAKAQELFCEETDVLDKEIDVMVMNERTFPRKSFILKRGAYDAPDKEVRPATPDQFFGMPDDFPKNRLGLAQWLIHDKNPLLARVMVNRMWQRYFGRGLVVSAEDFGSQGDLPTHLELLDWLAVSFRESGWNYKLMQKMIVMSATYRQSSLCSKELLEKDYDNKLYARGPSYRMAAEQVRDAALSASGLLSKKIGGPSVRPYQPAGIWEALATRNAVAYNQNHGDSLYRRSIYTIWKRSSPPPMMLNFDASERHTCSVRRQKTSTPLQALVTLNDPQFIEAARVLAEREIEFSVHSPQSTSSSTSKSLTPYTIHPTSNIIPHLFKSLISRNPRPDELKFLENLYEDELREFKKKPKSAEAFLKVGEYVTSKSSDKNQVAALGVVANTIMNFDEFLIKR